MQSPWVWWGQVAPGNTDQPSQHPGTRAPQAPDWQGWRRLLRGQFAPQAASSRCY